MDEVLGGAPAWVQISTWAGGYLLAVSLCLYIVRKLSDRKWVPEATHLDIVGAIEKDRDDWKDAYDQMAEVNKNNTLINMEWAETSRIIKEYIAARDRADEIEAARRGDKP